MCAVLNRVNARVDWAAKRVAADIHVTPFETLFSGHPIPSISSLKTAKKRQKV
jgi:hypothetical protein